LHDHKDKSLANLMVDKKLAVATEYLFPEKFAINRPIAEGIRLKPISTFFPLASILVPATLQIQCICPCFHVPVIFNFCIICMITIFVYQNIC
jgi:hypothetical protein